jgi:hypothetical protein
MGAVESLGAICPAVGFSVGGIIATLSSPRDAFLVAGLGATMSTAAFVRLPLGAHAEVASGKVETANRYPAVIRPPSPFSEPEPSDASPASSGSQIRH